VLNVVLNVHRKPSSPWVPAVVTNVTLATMEPAAPPVKKPGFFEAALL
jgi:hypothetical protein